MTVSTDIDLDRDVPSETGYLEMKAELAYGI